MGELDRIVAQLEQQKAAIDRALSALRDVGAADGNASELRWAPQSPAGSKHGLTPAGRKRIAEAARRRWAEKRSAEAEQARAAKNAAAAQKRRATLVRKRLSEAMKQRWAAKKAARSSSGQATKKTVAKGGAAQRTPKKAVSKPSPAPAQAAE